MPRTRVAGDDLLAPLGGLDGVLHNVPGHGFEVCGHGGTEGLRELVRARVTRRAGRDQRARLEAGHVPGRFLLLEIADRGEVSRRVVVPPLEQGDDEQGLLESLERRGVLDLVLVQETLDVPADGPAQRIHGAGVVQHGAGGHRSRIGADGQVGDGFDLLGVGPLGPQQRAEDEGQTRGGADRGLHVGNSRKRVALGGRAIGAELAETASRQKPTSDSSTPASRFGVPGHGFGNAMAPPAGLS